MLRIVTVVLLTLLGSACSRTDFAYRNADLLLDYYAYQTIRASAAQRDDWQPLVETTLQHHREQELPLVIAYLDIAGRIVGEAQSQVGAECLVDGALSLYQQHARLAVDLALPLLADLDADQVRHLAEYTTKRQKKSVERYLEPDPELRKKARQKRFIERIEKWTGKLDDRQQQQIREDLERIPDLSPSWLAYRTHQTDTLLTLLRNDADRDALGKHLENWWVRMDGQSTQSRRSWDSTRLAFVRLIDALATTLSDTQRATFGDRLGEVRRDLASFLPQSQQSVNLQLVPACTSPAT